MQKNLYEVIGVPQTATAEEIKKAYRKASLTCHPDRGGSTEDFQELQRAHEILSDPEKRAHYDSTGKLPSDDGGAGPDLSELFGSFFAGGGGGGGGFPFFGMGMSGGGLPSKAPVGPNKLHEIGVSMSDLYHGKTIDITMKRDVLCTGCNGKGGQKLDTCKGCNGKGMSMHMQQMGPMISMMQEPCTACNQTGKTAADKCGICGGRCVTEAETTLTAHIKPGMQEGDRLVFPGQCSESPLFEKPGDVVLVIRSATSDDPRWIRAGADLKTEVVLTVAEALLGWERTLEGHPSGELMHIKWTGGVINHGTWLTVAGKGMPVGAGRFGSLRVFCRIAQETLSEEQQRILRSVWPEYKEVVGGGALDAIRE